MDRRLFISIDRNAPAPLSKLTDVTEQLDGRFDSPIVIVVGQQGVSVEELLVSLGNSTERMLATHSRVESTHVTVWDRVSVDDLLADHILSCFGCLFLVDPARH